MKQALSRQAAGAGLRQLYERELAAAHAVSVRNDAESLHDLRVALRRLTVLVEQLATASHKRKTLLHAIKALLKQTNRGRDAQVMLKWLQWQWPQLSEAEQSGARQWQRILERQLRQRQSDLARLAIAVRRLQPTLASLSARTGQVEQSLGELLVQTLRQRTDELASLLQSEDVLRQLHLVRLKAKTVRYLLEPFCDEDSPDCLRALEELQRLQTQLGEWHDTVVRQQSLVKFLRKEFVTLTCNNHVKGAKGDLAKRSLALPGLLALARSNNVAQKRLVAHITRDYLHKDHAHLSNLLLRAISELRKAATLHD